MTMNKDDRNDDDGEMMKLPQNRFFISQKILIRLLFIRLCHIKWLIFGIKSRMIMEELIVTQHS